MSESDRTPEDMKELVVKNPAVDVEQVIEVSKLVEALRDGGMAKPEYNIESPYKLFPRRAK